MKKIKKRILSASLVFVMTFSLIAPSVVAADAEQTGIEEEAEQEITEATAISVADSTEDSEETVEEAAEETTSEETGETEEGTLTVSSEASGLDASEAGEGTSAETESETEQEEAGETEADESAESETGTETEEESDSVSEVETVTTALLLGSAASACDHGNDAETCVVCEVEALIDELPTVDEISAMDTDGQNEVYTQASEICDAYYELTEDEQEQVSNIDDLWDVLDYFSGAVSLTASDSVNYIYYNSDDYDNPQTGSVSTYTTITSSTTTWSDGWYVVDTNVTISGRITVSGTVNLILVDGYTLTASEGITVNSGDSLNIYGQDEGTGTLTAVSTTQYYAGIGGGGTEQSNGTITINGGTITATGGAGGAGIGGGFQGAGQNITINGGTITATGKTYSTFYGGGAGIGGGAYSGASNITINGGEITANGSSYGAGIGCGRNNSASYITINGGIVTATGGNNGAGIGGGSWSGASNITINGGTVTATGDSGAGIGSGYYANAGASDITISGGDVTANGGASSAGIGGGVESNGSDITITGGTVTVTTTAGNTYGAGIGGGWRRNGSNITISGGYLLITTSGTAIGGGASGSSSNIVITGGYFGTGDIEALTVYSTSVANGYGVISNTDVDTSATYPYLVSANTYNVTLNTNGGTISDGKNITSYTCGTGATLPTAADINKTDYVFCGWYEKEDFSGTAVTEISTTDYGAKTYYARWIKESQTVTFDSQDGSSVNSKTVAYGGTYGELDTPTRTGYTFTGWYTAATDGTLVTSDTIVTADDDHTLYAHWYKNEQTVTFDSQGGSEVTSSITVTYGEAYGTLPETAYDGYTFVGWYTAATDGTLVTSDTLVTAEDDHILYAHWDCAHNTFNSDGFCICGGYYQPADWNGSQYEIGNVGQLLWFAALVNGDSTHAEFTSDDTARGAAANAVLTANIDMSSYSSYFVPIGRIGTLYNTISSTASITSNGYTGTFDGQGHVISNLTISSVSAYDIGIFGTLSGTVKNLGVYNFSYSQSSGDVRGGALAGQILPGGTVEDCYVQSSSVNCSGGVGGVLAGANFGGTVENCYVVSSSVSGSRTGYLIGDNKNDSSSSAFYGTVTNCYTDKSSNIGQTGTSADVSYKSSNAFASGEVTYLLNGSTSEGTLVWYQNVDYSADVDLYPVFTASDNTIVYQVNKYDCIHDTMPETAYSNTNEDIIDDYSYYYFLGDENEITVYCSECWEELTYTISAPDSLTYDGNRHDATVTLDAEDGLYSYASDESDELPTTLTVSYQYSATEEGEKTSVTDTTAAGYYTARMTLGGTTASVTYTVARAALSESDFTVDTEDVDYTGSEITKSIVSELELGEDYTVEYTGNTAVGTATITITGIGNYTGELTYEFQIVDRVAPTGSLIIGTNSWDTFWNDVTFGIFFNETQTVTVTASDAESGVAKTEYYLANAAMTEDELAEVEWTVFTGDSFNIDPENNYVVYVKITDHSGNTTIINSDGIVLESTAPVITGLVDKKTYCSDVTFTVSDDNLDYVMIDYEVAEGTEVTAGTEYSYTITADNGKHIVQAFDKAGNTSIAYTVAVNNGHTWTYEVSEDGSTITEACFYCDESTSVSIVAPSENLVYNGENHDAELAYDGTLSGGNDLSISYTLDGETVANIVKAGTYTASIIYGGETVSVTYTIEKAEATISAAVASKTYGEEDPALTGTVTDILDADLDGFEISYSREAGEDAGDYTITPSYTENSNYTVTVNTATFTIEKAPITVTVDSVIRNVGDSNPNFTFTMTEGELVGDDTEDDLAITLTTEATKDSAVGTYAITGTSTSANYDVTITSGTLTIVELTALPEQEFTDGLDHMLLIKVGLDEVPEGLQEIEDLDTVDEITSTLTSILISQCGYPEGNTIIYDVTLMVSEDGGATWKEATAENFPANGLTVVLPYPDGTAKDTHDFAATHMFTTTDFGNTPGDTEDLTVTKTDEGLQVTVNGLSPIVVAWDEISTDSSSTDDSSGSGSSSDSAGGSSDSTSSSSSDSENDSSDSTDSESTSETIAASDSVATGDTSNLAFWIVLMAAACAGICTMVFADRKRKR